MHEYILLSMTKQNTECHFLKYGKERWPHKKVLEKSGSLFWWKNEKNWEHLSV